MSKAKELLERYGNLFESISNGMKDELKVIYSALKKNPKAFAVYRAGIGTEYVSSEKDAKELISANSRKSGIDGGALLTIDSPIFKQAGIK